MPFEFDHIAFSTNQQQKEEDYERKEKELKRAERNVPNKYFSALPPLWNGFSYAEEKRRKQNNYIVLFVDL